MQIYKVVSRGFNCKEVILPENSIILTSSFYGKANDDKDKNNGIFWDRVSITYLEPIEVKENQNAN
jgi:hypothetical protein